MNKKKSVNVRNQTLTVLTAFLALVSLSSCVGDKNINDWRASQVQEHDAASDPILGTYAGSLTSSDGQSLGTVTLVMKRDHNVQASADNTQSELQSTIRGTLYYSGVTQASIPFQQGYYNEVDGSFDAPLTITDSSGAAVQKVTTITQQVSP